MEPRTPLKRQRVPVNRFQSPAVEELILPSTSGIKSDKSVKDEPTKLYRKGLFLAVRGDAGKNINDLILQSIPLRKVSLYTHPLQKYWGYTEFSQSVHLSI